MPSSFFLSFFRSVCGWERAISGWPASVLVNALGTAGLWLEGALLCGAAVLSTWGLFHVLRRLERVIDANGLAQGHYLDSLDIRYVDAAIIFSAALSLFIELALIRWQSSVVVFLAFYKNFSLLACFAGLGLGYALATRSRIPLAMVVPLLAAQFCFILLFRLAPDDLSVNPFREQLTMGLQQGDWVEGVALFLLLSVLFLLTALTFVPIGQLCGRLMERRRNLRAYGLNLLGSLLGVIVMLVASLLWTSPLVWFALCFLGILLFYLRRPSALTAGFVFSVVGTIVLAWWPISPLLSRVYSPYQLVEIGTDGQTGLTLIRAAGHYYQRISAIMAMNLLGAIVGGLLEYNSMYVGFQALYLMAMACYALAMVSQWIFVDKDAAGTATPSRVP